MHVFEISRCVCALNWLVDILSVNGRQERHNKKRASERGQASTAMKQRHQHGSVVQMVPAYLRLRLDKGQATLHAVRPRQSRKADNGDFLAFFRHTDGTISFASSGFNCVDSRLIFIDSDGLMARYCRTQFSSTSLRSFLRASAPRLRLRSWPWLSWRSWPSKHVGIRMAASARTQQRTIMPRIFDRPLAGPK
jgi:hypothetical protein